MKLVRIAIALVLAAVFAGCGDSSDSERGADDAVKREARGKGFEGRQVQTFVNARDFCEIEPRSEFAVSEGLPARSSGVAIARAYAAEWPPKMREAAFEGCRAGLANVPARFPASSPQARDIWGRHFVVTSVAGEEDEPPVARPIYIRVSFSDEREHSIGWQGRCNGFGGNVRFTATEMRVGGLGSTLVGCSDEVEEEDGWLADFLGGHPEWELDGEQLRLVSDDATVELRGPEDPDTCLITPGGGRVHLGNTGLGCESALNFVSLYVEGRDRYTQGWTCRESVTSHGRRRLVCREGATWFAVDGFDRASFERR